jgi:hypothetical protein
MVSFEEKGDCLKGSGPLMSLAKYFMEIIQRSLVKSVNNA